MKNQRFTTVDGNQAAASVAYRASEVIAIYPITPSSPMGEFCEEWATKGLKNVWGHVPYVQEMQSEAGAAGAVHGALQAGTFATTFTASQGLLLMIPNMLKIAGELTPFVMHVAARTLATHALSIFGDHQDVMCCRSTGFAMLCSSTPQEAHDFAAVSHRATLLSRIPFLHFFDGFRTSHELGKIELLSDEQLKSILPEAALVEHRLRALTPDRPVIRGTAQNPDVFFQAREACNPFYDQCVKEVDAAFEEISRLTGRTYKPFDYFGHPEAERVILLMGSGVTTARLVAEKLVARGEKVGVLAVRLFRPFSLQHMLAVLPKSVKRLAVLDRTKEPGASGEPLLQEVAAALMMSPVRPQIFGGRYGISSKEFTPEMVASVFAHLSEESPKTQFTVGIIDDVTHLSLPAGERIEVLPEGTFQALFFGLGADGTVSANKNSIKIIGELTDLNVQGHFVYDSKKSGAMTVSHLRVGKGEVSVPYLVQSADFVACHEPAFLERIDLLKEIRQGGTFLVNSHLSADKLFDSFPRELQEQIIARGVQLYTIDALEVAKEAGVGQRINTIMQICFFQLCDFIPADVVKEAIKGAIKKTYGNKGQKIVDANLRAVDLALAHMKKVSIPAQATTSVTRRELVAAEAPDFVHNVTAKMMALEGDNLPVSVFTPDGTWPTGTTRWEKRDIAESVPEWEKDLCIQCNKCVQACPHAALRAKVYDAEATQGADVELPSLVFKSPDASLKGKLFTIQLSPDDCTGCQLCSASCPSVARDGSGRKALSMVDKEKIAAVERERFKFFESKLPETVPAALDVKHVQLRQPLFEFSGACTGCGQTPYVKLLSQLFGDRLLIANATGCSSIYGGNLPTTPYTTNPEGRGPAWANSLFEDNAEFGLGFRLAVDQLKRQASTLVKDLSSQLPGTLVDQILNAEQVTDAQIAEQRGRILALRQSLASVNSEAAKQLALFSDYLVEKSVWIMGGDGWAYDIGFGGLDHVLSQPHDVNILVMDTGAYSNTGGQQSKATPRAATAKFAQAGKDVGRKDLGRIAMTYPHAYVAQVAIGARDQHTVKTLAEAASYKGPSLIIAYAHCIAHGCDMTAGLEQQKLAVDTGFWPLYRCDPRRAAQGETPLQLDFGYDPKRPIGDFTKNENRFRSVARFGEERMKRLQEELQAEINDRNAELRRQAGLSTQPPADAE